MTSPRYEDARCNSDPTAGQSCNIETSDKIFEHARPLCSKCDPTPTVCAAYWVAAGYFQRSHNKANRHRFVDNQPGKELVILTATSTLFIGVILNNPNYRMA